MQQYTVKPFLKWVGGKGGLLNQYNDLLPKTFETYYEPFLGGGAVFYHLNPSTAHLNDVNSKLINTYKAIKNSVKDLILVLEKIEVEYIQMSEEERKKYYYDKRERFNFVGKSIEQSALLIFLNKTTFNGMYRENSKGEFNVPQGRYKNPKILDKDNLISVSKYLQNVSFTSTDYVSAVSTAKKNDFVYLDPPYHPLSATSSFTSYSKNNFTEQDQVNLRDLFVDLDSRECKVMLSNSSADLIKEIYKDFKQVSIQARRSINSKSTKRGNVTELAILNY